MKDFLLFAAIQSICACVIGWILLVGALILGPASGQSIVISIVAGFILAFPAAFFVKRKLVQSS